VNDGTELLASLSVAVAATALSSTFSWLLAAVCFSVTVSFFGYRFATRRRP
jgi:hypothetical protein